MTAVPFTECLLCAKHYSSIHAASKINKQRAKHWEYKCIRWGACSFSGARRLNGEMDKEDDQGQEKCAPCCQAQRFARVQKSTNVNMRKLLKEVVSPYNTRGWNLRVRKVK